jgi:predicted enzyme related to lactoylglutathione lyase
MGCPVVQFEIGCRDIEKAGEFYSALFDWSIGELHGTTVAVDTGSDRGVAGTLTALGHEPHRYVHLYVEVEDLRRTVDLATARGGDVMIGPLDIPDGSPYGRFAWIADPDGNTLGLLEPRR